MTAAALTARLSPRRSRSRRPRAAHVLQVVFDQPGGRRWSAVGGGASVPEALADAQAALPPGRWELVSFRQVYGD